MTDTNSIAVRRGDALIVVDVQIDFLPGGALAVPDGDEVIRPLNLYIEHFEQRARPVIATRDWHPIDHCSFEQQGGPWPPHCVCDTQGAEFSPDLCLPTDVEVISKATEIDRDAYSGFEGTDLAMHLKRWSVTRVLIGGLATDYCVLNTVRDAIKENFKVALLKDAIRAVNVNAGDGEQARNEMIALGARPIAFHDLCP